MVPTVTTINTQIRILSRIAVLQIERLNVDPDARIVPNSDHHRPRHGKHYGDNCLKLDHAIWVVFSPSERLTTNVVDDRVSFMAMM
jgi:hypothetical protein